MCDKMEGEWVINVSEKFDLERAVCNHGFFMMSPNKWISSRKSLLRPLSLPNHSLVTVSITHPANKNYIVVTLLKPGPLLVSPQDQQSIHWQVARMLRISAEDEMMVEEFHRILPLAEKSGFARIFRSPTLFEDIVKSLLLCYCSSLEMAEGLCNLERKRSDNGSVKFPSPKEIACLDVKTLNKHCNLGYRAAAIVELARNIENGSLNLDDFETPLTGAPTYHLATSHHYFLWKRLIKIKGFGSFTVANVMMCIGFYQHIPIDTETVKHLKQVHGKTKLSSKKRQIEATVAKIYDKYAPFQCLAYWMERIEYYEKNLGKLSELPRSKYCNVTSTNF